VSPAPDTTLLDVLFHYGVDLRARRVFFHGGIGTGEEMGKSPVETVTKALLYLDKTTGGIELWLNTPGGYVAEMWGLFDVIRTRSNVVTTVGFGEVCSAGCLLLAAGDRRLVTPNCWFMWHSQDTDEESGRLIELKHRIRAWERQEKRWLEEMGRLTKKTEGYWSEKMGGELWLDAKQLVQHGVADEIIEEVARPQ